MGSSSRSQLIKQGIEPNVITYLAEGSACRKSKMPEWAMRLFNEMQQQPLEPIVITCSAVIR